MFDMKTGMWSDKQNVHLSVLGDLEEHLHLIAFDEKKMEWKRYARSYGNDSVLAKKMIPFLKSMCIDDDWIMRDATSSLGKLLFADGYLDLKTGELYDFDLSCTHADKIQKVERRRDAIHDGCEEQIFHYFTRRRSRRLFFASISTGSCRRSNEENNFWSWTIELW